MNALFKVLGLCLALGFSFLLTEGAAKAANEAGIRLNLVPGQRLPANACGKRNVTLVSDKSRQRPSRSVQVCCALNGYPKPLYKWLPQENCTGITGMIVANSYCKKLVCCALKGFPNVPYKWLQAGKCTGYTGWVVPNNYCLKPSSKASKTLKNGAVIKRRKTARRCCLVRGRKPFLTFGRCKGRYVPISHCRR